MLNILNIDEPIIVNGKRYASSAVAFAALKDFKGEIEIVLNHKEPVAPSNGEDTQPEKPAEKEIFIFQLPLWLARKNSCPLEIQGTIEAETGAALLIQGKGIATASTYCRVCGKLLTNEKSVRIGVGPVCFEKIGGYAYNTSSDDDIVNAGKKLEEMEFKLWVPKSLLSMKKVA